MRGHQSSVSQCHADNDHDLMIVHISPPHVWQQKGVELVDIHRTHYEIINYCHNSYPVKAVGAICEDLR